MAEPAVWGIIGLPLASFVLIAFVIRPLQHSLGRWSGYLTVLALAGALLLSVLALSAVSIEQGRATITEWRPHQWFVLGDPQSTSIARPWFEMTVGLLLDPLAAIMAVVVSGVSLMVQIYSLGYMAKQEPGERYADYPRYFAYMSLFTASMLGLVLSRNLIQLFVFWELVGLCSYLLIGFWHHRPAAAAAAKKAWLKRWNMATAGAPTPRASIM